MIRTPDSCACGELTVISFAVRVFSLSVSHLITIQVETMQRGMFLAVCTSVDSWTNGLRIDNDLTPVTGRRNSCIIPSSSTKLFREYYSDSISLTCYLNEQRHVVLRDLAIVLPWPIRLQILCCFSGVLNSFAKLLLLTPCTNGTEQKTSPTVRQSYFEHLKRSSDRAESLGSLNTPVASVCNYLNLKCLYTLSTVGVIWSDTVSKTWLLKVTGAG